ncbi:DUF4430 domain-containing protein [Candidatus Kaiserbacteria bacterium]|nr:DUF4430 domain-containing protein [Candidatus Kaiserbacteria bacterium]
MKKYFILIGAVAAVVITAAFSYTYRGSPASQTVSVNSYVATTSRATFKVGDKTYQTDVAPNENVIGAMRTLSSTADFTYTSREYPGLGVFVDSINGIKNSGGMYWILYTNGVTASLGASATVLKADDVIEWKYEKSF